MARLAVRLWIKAGTRRRRMGFSDTSEPTHTHDGLFNRKCQARNFLFRPGRIVLIVGQGWVGCHSLDDEDGRE